MNKIICIFLKLNIYLHTKLINNMVKKIAAFLLIVFTSIGVIAQIYQLPNSGFENWDGSSADDEPTNWNGFPSAQCDLSGLASFGCGSATSTRHEKSTETRPGSSGSYSLKLFATVINILGSDIPANGTITTGQIRIGSTTASNPENYNISRTDNANMSQVFNAKPDSIVFWAKFVCPNADQKARLSAAIHDDYDYRDPADSDSYAVNHIVGTAIKNFPRGDQNWHRYSVEFDYDYPAISAEYILITFTTNMIAGEGSESDYLYIDDIEFIYVTDLLNITIDGVNLDGFSPNICSYNVDASCGNIPIVDADCLSQLGNVEIIQSDGVSPAQIIVTNGNESKTYIINFNYVNVTEVYDEICEGNIYSDNGFDLGLQDNVGTFTYENLIYESQVCDSIVKLHLTVNPIYFNDTIDIMICETAEYNFYGTIITEPGVYEKVLPTINGCDSTIILNLTVGEFYRTYINAGICDGETYNENEFDMNYQGIDTLVYTAQNGCDSLVILNLDVYPNYESEFYDTVIQRNTYINHGFEIFATNSPGDYTFENNLFSSFGCDSTVYLYLNIQEVPKDTTITGNSEFGFLLYPNPSTKEVILKAESHINISLEYVIYDIFGKIISNGMIINDETCIEVKKYAAGVYFIRINSEQGDSETIKFIKY